MKKFILKNDRGRVYAPYGSHLFSDVTWNAEKFSKEDAHKLAEHLVNQGKADYIQVIPVVCKK